MRVSKKKIFIIIVFLVILIFPLKKYIQIKQEFSNYLEKNYPETSFNIGMIWYDPICPKIFAKVKSEDDIEFIIKRPPGSNKIFENYLTDRYEKDAVGVIEKYLGQELLKNIKYIRCYIDTEKISYPNYSNEDLLNNIDSLVISYKSKSMNNFNEFFQTANEVFKKLNDQEIQVKNDINIYTYTVDNLDCDLSKVKEAYTLRVMVVAEDITTNNEYLQKREEIKKNVDNSKMKLTRVNISIKGDLK